MSSHPISDNMDSLSVAETILVYLIDNGHISGLDAINLMKAIWENDRKEKPLTLLSPKEPSIDRTLPRIVPNSPTVDPTLPPWHPKEPYNPITVWYENKDQLSNQYTAKEQSNVTTTVHNSNSSSITWDEWDKAHLTASDNPLNESKVFNKKS